MHITLFERTSGPIVLIQSFSFVFIMRRVYYGVCCVGYFSVYKISPTRELLVETFGNWTRTNGIIDVRPSPLNSRRRHDLAGEKLTQCIALPNKKTKILE